MCAEVAVDPSPPSASDGLVIGKDGMAVLAWTC